MKQYRYLLIVLFMLGGCSQLGGEFLLRNISSGQKIEIKIIEPTQLKAVQQNQKQGVVVIIDVFRAFTTASYVLEKTPSVYILAKESSVISRLAARYGSPLLVGKPEKGVALAYDIPNSPTRVQEVKIEGREVLHRTEGGAGGLLLANGANIVLAAGFVNAAATARYIRSRSLPGSKIIIVAMGHEGISPSLEDDICAEYIKALISEKKIDLSELVDILKEGSGKYFFSKDQWQYPEGDFYRCLEIDRFNFVIKAVVKDGYAVLTRGDQGA